MALIEREVALEILENCAEYYSRVDDCTEHTIRQCISAIKKIAVEDAAPVVHGRWEEVDWVEPDGHSFGTVRILKAGLQCNKCANVFRKKLLWKDNYCPNCGARMDGGEGHEN